jgi:hypothetical protein
MTWFWSLVFFFMGFSVGSLVTIRGMRRALRKDGIDL